MEETEYEWIDDCFRVYETQYKLWHSVTKEGQELITALHKESCITATRFYLKGIQEGWTEKSSRYEGTVGGKL